MSKTARRACSDRAKKLRSLLRDHYTRDDLTRSITDLVTDAMHLCDQRGIAFNTIVDSASAVHDSERKEARS